MQPLEELGLDFWEEVWEVEEQRVEDVRVEVGHVEADRQGGLEVDFRAVERGATARRFQQLQAKGLWDIMGEKRERWDDCGGSFWSFADYLRFFLKKF